MMVNELDSPMILIHPPLAVIGYAFTIILAISLFVANRPDRKIVKLASWAAWFFAFLGLVTGMIWAQIAWGSYWSWDPKETLTLMFFLSLSTIQLALSEKKMKLARGISLLSCALFIATLSSSFLTVGLHSFL